MIISKKLVLQKTGAMKIASGEFELYEKDLEEIPKGITPGEWVYLENLKTQEQYVAFINKFVTGGPCCYVVVKKDQNVSSVEELLEKLITRSISYRNFLNLGQNSRLVYGSSDNLPGLIVDSYENVVIVQINTAGMDLFRTMILDLFKVKLGNKKVVALDNENYRKRECLPVHENNNADLDIIHVLENEIRYELSWENIQKLGHYYDHRVNRQRFKSLVENSQLSKDKGLDLFCYSGSWGLHLLKTGLAQVDFVDQADMGKIVSRNVELNGFAGSSEFYRGDCFKFLDKRISSEQKYKVICSDPPAFAKDSSAKRRAIDGYQKLHDKIMKICAEDALVAIGSCTHYVSYEELDQTVQLAATRNKRKIRLVDSGVQGLDHPIHGLNDKSNYIKYLAYYVE